MNKDVIYIEPEDDITDILSKLTGATEKVVALVPPKKAGVLRSAVNIKLIARTAKNSEKVAVLVTADPTLVKMAATARVPIAKNLQSRPEIPDAAAVAAVAAEQVIDEDLSDSGPESAAQASSKASQKPQDASAEKKPATKADKGTELTDDELEADQAKKGKKSAKKGKNGKKVPDIKRTRKFIIIGAIAGVFLICFLVWALAFAPSAKITVAVKTTPNNLSENITFTLDPAKSDPAKGLFLLEEQKYEQESKVEFTATGQKDLGNKASGTLSIEHYFREKGSIAIDSGSRFTYNGMVYIATGGASLSWDGKDDSNCENGSSFSRGCRKTTSVAVQATESGEKYNLSAQTSGWSSPIGGISVYGSGAISGGSTNVVTVVQQSDVETARAKLASANEEEGKKALEEQVGKDAIIIKDSYVAESSNPVSSPAVGEEVKSGVSPTLTAKTVYRLYAVDRPQVEKYIDSKISLADDQKIYSYGDPIFDRFSGVSNGQASAKLKTTYFNGPKITEEEVMEKSRGKKIGEVQSQLKSINGVAEVKIDTSFFWVSSVPDDPNKVSIEMKVEENN